MNLQELQLVVKHAPGSLPLRVVNNLGQVCRVIGMSYDPLRPDDGFIFDIDAREEVLNGNVTDGETERWARQVVNRAKAQVKNTPGYVAENHYYLSVETPSGNYLTLSAAGIWEEGPAGGSKTEVPAEEVIPRLTAALMKLSGIREADPACPACGFNSVPPPACPPGWPPPPACPPPVPPAPVPDQVCGNPRCSVCGTPDGSCDDDGWTAAGFDDDERELADKLVDLTYDLFHALKQQLKSKLMNDPGLRERFLVGGKLTLLVPDQI